MAKNAPDDSLYDLVPDEDPSRARPAPMPAPPVPHNAAQPIAYRTVTREDAAAKFDPDEIKNLWMPLWLLGGGVVIEVIASFIRARNFVGALQLVGIGMVLGTITMLVGIMLAAHWRQIDLGKFWTAVFKLAAISVAPSAAGDLATPMLSRIPFGGLGIFIGEFVLYFALLGALFDLDQSDTWYCICVIFLVRLCVYFAVMFLLKA